MRVHPRLRVDVRIAVSIFALVLLLPTTLSAQSTPQRWDGLLDHLTTTGVIAPYLEEQQPNGPSALPRHALSADGRYVIFTSEATNLTPPPPGDGVYLRDRRTGETRKLYFGSGLKPALSADGMHVALQICDGSMRPDQQQICDIWVLDIVEPGWTLHAISVAADGTYGTADSTEPVITGNGRLVAFRTRATNLIPYGSTEAQIVVHDRDADGNGIFDEPGGTSFTLASAANGTGDAGNGPSESAEISDDGRYVAFRSQAGNLVAGAHNSGWNVFLRDIAAGTTRRLNEFVDGSPSMYSIDSAHISMTPDGRYVAFATRDPILAPASIDDTDGELDVLVYDRNTASLTRVDLTSDGLGGTGPVESPVLSADGRYVAVEALSSNASFPPAPISRLVHVYDRESGTSVKVSVRPDGIDPDRECFSPAMSGDGSIVAFVTGATNLNPWVTAGLDAIYGAVHFDIQPPEATIPALGGSATFTVTAQQHTRWWPEFGNWDAWFVFDTLPSDSVGNGSAVFRARTANLDPTPRTVEIRIGSKTLLLTQSEALTISGFDPPAGPMSGGMQIAVFGTGFSPQTIVLFDGIAAETTFVNDEYLLAMLPTHPPGLVELAVTTADTWAIAPYPFWYLDDTPPVISASVSGTLGDNGWYVSDVLVTWSVSDPESAVTADPGCGVTQTANVDGFFGFVCQASSEGGSSIQFFNGQRDASPPTIYQAMPAPTLYAADTTAFASYMCVDDTSGLVRCEGNVRDGERFDTSPGYHTFTVTAADQAGNAASKSVEYAISATECVPRPPGLLAWWPADGHMRDISGGHDGLGSSWFTEGIKDSAFFFTVDVLVGDTPDLALTGPLTLSAWVAPDYTHSKTAVILGREGEYLLGLSANRTLLWSIANVEPGWGWVDTGVRLDYGDLVHVVVTYDGTAVRTFLNGRLAHSAAASGTLGDVSPSMNDFRIGSRQEPANRSFFRGTIDEPFVADRALDANEIETLFLHGRAGFCPVPTALEIVPSIIQGPLAGSTTASARLTRGGVALSGIDVAFTVRAGDLSYWNFAPTDADGIARVRVELFGAPAGTHAAAVTAEFAGSLYDAAAVATADLAIDKGTPVVYVNDPGWVVYDGQPHVVTAVAQGIFWEPLEPVTITYNGSSDPPANAGAYTIVASFAGNDQYYPVSTTTTLTIERATPTVTVTGGTYTYDGLSHPATGSVTGIGGVSLGPLTITYNGQTDPPIDAGFYEVLAMFEGDGNYMWSGATDVVWITPATPVVTWPAPAPIVYGTPLGSAQLNAAATVPGTFEYVPAAGTLLNAGASQTLTVNFTPADPLNYIGVPATTAIDVAKATPAISVTGGTYTYDGTAHPATGSVTGATGSSLGPLTFTYNGRPDAPVNAGEYAVLASFAGDANHEPVSAATTVTIAKAIAPISWPAPAPIVYGTPLGAAELNASSSVPGSFAYSPTAGTVLHAGAAQQLSATFTPADPANYSGGVAAAAITVVPSPLTIRAVDVGKPFGAPLPMFTAAFVGLVNGDTPASLSGTLAFSTSATAASPVGSYAVAPSGLASADYAVTFAPGTLTIVRAATTVSVSTSPEPSGAGEPMRFTALVAPIPPGAGTATGTVSFRDGAVLLGTAAISGGAASLQTAGLDPGSRSITAEYSGDGSFEASSGSHVHLIHDSAHTPSVALATSDNSVTAGTGVTFIATVTMPAGAVYGTVTFYANGAVIGSAAIANGRATLQTSALPVGGYAITAFCEPIGDVPPAMSDVVAQTVVASGGKPKASAMSLVAPASSTLGQPVDFVATISASPGRPTPTGVVLFMADGSVVGTVALSPIGNGDARAVLRTSVLAHGRHEISATYLADASSRASAGMVRHVVN